MKGVGPAKFAQILPGMIEARIGRYSQGDGAEGEDRGEHPDLQQNAVASIPGHGPMRIP